MSVTTKQYAEIAKKHGLGLADAAALKRLADTVEEAEEAAEIFAPAQDGPSANEYLRGKIADKTGRSSI